MRFLEPAYLAWAGLAAAVIVLYFFRRRPLRLRVSTLIFYKSLAREHRESSWLRKLKRFLSLLLSLLILLGAVGALARLAMSPPAEGLQGAVLLIERGAAMQAQVKGGLSPSLMETAKSRARERLGSLPPGVPVSVIAYDARPEIVLSATLDRRQVERTIADIKARPIAADDEAARVLAGQLAGLATPAIVWQISSHAGKVSANGEATPDPGAAAVSTNFPPAPTLATTGSASTNTPAAPTPNLTAPSPASKKPSGITWQRDTVVLPAPINAGITACQLRRLPDQPGKLELFAEINGVSPGPLPVTAELLVDGRLVATRSITLHNGEPERMLLPLDAGSGRTAILRLRAKEDMLAADDEAYIPLPDIAPLRILWVYDGPPNPFTAMALAALGGDSDVKILQGAPPVWPPTKPVEVVIFENWLPEKWPADQAVIVINPPRSLGPVMVEPLATGLPLDRVTVERERHPVLYGVANDRVALTQSGVIPTSSQLSVLWTGPYGALLAAGESGGQRLVEMTFSSERSERLPLLASWPLLVGNAVYWVSQPARDLLSQREYRTGDLLASRGAKKITWRSLTSAEVVPIRGPLFELQEVGEFQTDTGQLGGASLLSRQETMLASDSPSPSNTTAGWTSWFTGWLRGDLSAAVIAVVVAICLGESWLFHRHGVN